MKEQLYKINQVATELYHKQLYRYNNAQEYLKKRNITNNTIEELKIGYANDENSLYNYLKEQGYSNEIIEGAGLVGKDEEGNYIDRYKNRIIFPILNEENKIIAFGARVLDDNSKPKYINSPETSIYSKKHSLYGIDIAKDYAENGIIIVEGYIDFVTMYQSGFKNVVAILGTAITDEQIKLLKKYTNKVIIVFDSDLAGQCATKRAIEKLKAYDIKYTNITLEGANDVDEFINKYGVDGFKNLLNNTSEDAHNQI